LDCLLKVSKAQQTDQTYTHALMDGIHEQMMHLLYSQCYHIAFPENVLVFVEMVCLFKHLNENYCSYLQLRTFCKDCKVSVHVDTIRSVMHKVVEQLKWVEERRTVAAIDLTDENNVV
jgi:hypothetical protein